MQDTDQRRDDVRVSVENVGGIDDATVAFSPGVTLLVGRNATNRTSFLQAVKAGLGSDEVSIKGDAESASVELTVDGETYTRRLRREGDGRAASGDPFLDDPTVADLFAFLLESNEARRAVVTGADLRELVMRPVDTAAIRAEIDDLVDERESLRADLAEIEELKGDLPALEERRAAVRDRVAETRAALESVEADIDAADVEQRRVEQSELEDRFAELQERRSTLADVRYDLETERESRAALVEEREDLRAELADLPEPDGEGGDDLGAELARRRDRKRRLETELDELQNVVAFNEELLDGAEAGVFADVAADDGPVTDRLLGEDRVTCWTCGSAVDRDRVEETVDRLRELSRTKVAEVNDLAAEIEELETERSERERARRERERLRERLSSVESEIEAADDRIERLRERRSELVAAVEAAEAAVEAVETDDRTFDDVLELYEEANELEYELDQHEADLDSVESEIETVEARLDEEEAVEARLDEVTDEIESLRTRIDRVERDAVERFNDHAADVLDLLGYDNLDRVWLERVEREVGRGRGTTTETAFDLHVVRSSADGTAYEDTVEHLSESEREVTGLVFALAGYLAHRVYEELPFVLLDSLEAIDADRIAGLVDHFADYADYLLVVLLPEDAAALPDRYERVTEI